MIIRPRHNSQSGSTRVKVFALIFAAMILADIVFRSSDGLKTIFRPRPAASAVTNTVVVAPTSVVTSTPSPLEKPMEQFEEPVAVLKAPSTNTPERMQPIVLPYGSDGHGKLAKATADIKGRAPVVWPPNTPANKSKGKLPAQPPLPIALPQ